MLVTRRVGTSYVGFLRADQSPPARSGSLFPGSGRNVFVEDKRGSRARSRTHSRPSGLTAGGLMQQCRLAALVPKPRVNLTRYHGVLATNRRWRGMTTPAKHGNGVKRIANPEVRSPSERHVAMSEARRLNRVFNTEKSWHALQLPLPPQGGLKASASFAN